MQWVLIVGFSSSPSSHDIVKNSLGTGWGGGGYMKLARGGNVLGVGNYASALMAGPPSTGSCSLPEGSCFEMTSADCSAANGGFGGTGTFCATPCAASAALAAVPALSHRATASLVFVLAMVGLALLLRKAPCFR